MSAWVWTALILLGAVAVVVGRWRDALQARVERRQAEHDAMVDAILTSDPEIAALEACWRMPARQPDHR